MKIVLRSPGNFLKGDIVKQRAAVSDGKIKASSEHTQVSNRLFTTSNTYSSKFGQK